MPSNADPLNQKESFLRDNELFTELELNEEARPIGKFREIDLSENEIWLLQCPKGMNIAEFEDQKLKIPGRTNIKNSEAISMELNNGKEQHAFAYYNRKGHYSLRLLPVCGTIVIRDRLKAAEIVSSKRAEECCPPSKRVPLPSTIRERHPLLGAQYNDKVYLDVSIKKRLQEADEDSTKITKETMNQKYTCLKAKPKSKVAISTNNKSPPIELYSSDEDEDKVEFVSEEMIKTKTKKSKRKHSESLAEDNNVKIKKKKSKKTSKIEEIVSKDLQWLQNI